MASIRSTIELVITGSTRGLGAAAAEARRMAERVAEAEDRVSDARRRQAEASSRVAEAEARLNRARQSGNPDAIAAASERLARARGQEFAASERLARAERDLAVIRRRGNNDINRQRDGVLGIFDAFSRLAGAFSGADGASTSLLAKLGALNSVISSIGGPIVQAVVGLLQMAAIMGAIGEIVGVLGGLIGQALAGVPVLLLAIAAAAGTVALGMDGIKKAAEVIAPAFQQLKRDVSEVFVRQLTPAFRDLAAALPKLTDGFRFIAVSLSGIAQQVIGFVTSAHGIEVINGILRGTATLFSSMAPGIRTFVQGLLEAANVGKTAFAALGTALGSILGRIGEVFTRLAGDGTIARAVQGLAATLTGLGAVIAPLIELFIRMGAALGDSVGVALTGIGSGIQQVIPFFEKLAQVAGQVLVDAFNQLGPPLRELADSILPGAGAGLDGFASIMHNVVLPAITGFINFLRTDGIPGIVAFTKGAIVQFLEFSKGVIAAVDVVLATVQGLFTALALIPGPFQQQFAQGAAVIQAYREKLDGLKTTINGIEAKTVAFTVQVPSDRTTGEQGILGVAAAMDRAAAAPKTTAFTVRVPSDRTTGEQGILGVVAAQERVQNKTVTTTANVPSGPTQGTLGNQVLEGAIGAVINKTVTTTSNVPGTPVVGTMGNQALSGAIAGVTDKVTTTTGNVPGGPTLGTQGNQALTSAINNVISKTVQITANVAGEGAVRSLISAIAGVVSKTVNIVANVIGNPFGRASGGPVLAGQTYMVGEKGPELLTMGGTSGYITDATRTRQMLNSPGRGKVPAGTSAASSADPIILAPRIYIGDREITDLVRVEMSARDRATKRTVLAGSGVTF